MVSACSPDGDVVGAATDGESGDEEGEGGSGEGSDSDGIPTSGEGLSGSYRIESFTLECSGDCSAPSELFGPVSYCDVGNRDTDYARIEHSGTEIQFDLDEGRAEGTLSADGSFSASGEATESGGAVTLRATLDGAFTGRHGGFTAVLEYTAVGQHDGDAISCRGKLEIVGNWDSDECDEEPGLCPDAYPICFQDACNAGVAGDPCWEAEHCAAGLVCVDDSCRAPGAVSEVCEEDAHCNAGLVCFEEACSAGNVGDACSWPEHCKSGICLEESCSAGAPGDVCLSDTHCAEGSYCVFEACSAGAVGDACDWGDDCDSGFCVDDVCSAGAVGDPCVSNSDCASEICVEDRCRAGVAGDPCTWDDECTGGLSCVDDVCGG